MLEFISISLVVIGTYLGWYVVIEGMFKNKYCQNGGKMVNLSSLKEM